MSVLHYDLHIPYWASDPLFIVKSVKSFLPSHQKCTKGNLHFSYLNELYNSSFFVIQIFMPYCMFYKAEFLSKIYTRDE